jgi:hypothetical protein
VRRLIAGLAAIVSLIAATPAIGGWLFDGPAPASLIAGQSNTGICFAPEARTARSDGWAVVTFFNDSDGAVTARDVTFDLDGFTVIESFGIDQKAGMLPGLFPVFEDDFPGLWNARRPVDGLVIPAHEPRDLLVHLTWSASEPRYFTSATLQYGSIPGFERTAVATDMLGDTDSSGRLCANS